VLSATRSAVRQALGLAAGGCCIGLGKEVAMKVKDSNKELMYKRIRAMRKGSKLHRWCVKYLPDLIAKVERTDK
jgi:hypothetical protein